MAAAEAEAIETATVIAGLRWRLESREGIGHPDVLGELRKLAEQISLVLEAAEEPAGRHRAPTDLSIGQRTDSAEPDYKPNPLDATTEEEFIEILWLYRAWSGNPSWRVMAKRAAQAVVHSTMYAAMNSKALPKLDVMKAIVTGCGGGTNDLEAFVTAWRRFATERVQRLSAETGLPRDTNQSEVTVS